MKFFTMDWWAGIQDHRNECDVDPPSDYDAYLRSLAGRLPKEFSQLNSDVSLHDCNLVEFMCAPEKKALTLKLRGDDGAGGLRVYSVGYEGLRAFQSKVHPDTGLPGPHGYGDFGYHETDIEADGTLVHRILFSTGIEFEITFTNFSIDWDDCGSLND